MGISQAQVSRINAPKDVMRQSIKYNANSKQYAWIKMRMSRKHNLNNSNIPDINLY
jgi:hypothetical protein